MTSSRKQIPVSLSGLWAYYWHNIRKGAAAMAKKQKRLRDRRPMEKAMELTNLSHRKTDPQGSYTGQPLDPREKPVQDADDL